MYLCDVYWKARRIMVSSWNVPIRNFIILYTIVHRYVKFSFKNRETIYAILLSNE